MPAPHYGQLGLTRHRFDFSTSRSTFAITSSVAPAVPVAWSGGPWIAICWLSAAPISIRDEIVDRLWGKDVFVDVETGIHGAIRKIAASRDVPERPMFVETVPGRGYRFIAPTEPPADTTETQASPVSPTMVAGRIPDSVPPSPREPESSLAAGPAESLRPFPRLAMSRVWGASVAALMIAALLTWRWYASDASASRVMLAVLPFENLSGDPGRDYLADGLWEEMVVALDKIDPQRVGVLGRSSIRDYQRSLK